MARSQSEKAQALLSVQFTGVEEEVAKLKKSMETLGAVVPKKIQDGFKIVDKQIDRLKVELETANDPDAFRGLQVSMSKVADEAEKIGKVIAQSQGNRGQIVDAGRTEAATIALRKYRDAVRQTGKETQRTVLMSQNMLRVIQDSPFGMIGMANNLQMLAENFSFAKMQGHSFTESMSAGLKTLFAGPMAPAAVVAIATVIIQKWDDIVEAGHVLSDMLDGLTESQKALNKVMRDFDSTETFNKFIETLNAEDMEKARKSLIGQRDALIGANEELKNLDLSVAKRKEGIKNFFRMIASMGPAGQGALDKSVLEEKISDLIAFNERIAKIDAELFQKRAEIDRMSKLGLETEDEKASKEKLKKDKENSDKAAIALIKAKEEQAELQRKFREDDLALEEEQTKALEKIEADRVKRRLEAERSAIQNMRAEIQAVARSVSTGDTEANAIGVGVFGKASMDISRDEQRKRIQLEAIFERAKVQEQIDVRREAQREYDELASRAAGKELIDIKSRHSKLEAEILSYEQKYTQITLDEETKRADIRKKFRDEDLAQLQAISNQIAGVFGSMATVLASESEKGLEQHKGLLKAAAWADAIAAGIAVYRNVAQAGKANPLVMVGAGAAMAATIAGLAAKIRQIDNPGGAGGGSGTSFSGGSYTSLNGQISAQRANAFNQGQNRLEQEKQAKATEASAASMEKIATMISTQKVVIDQSTIAEVARMGNATNKRRVQFSS